MQLRTCPACDTHTAHLLDALSQHSSVNYYRCPSCHHVWTARKDDPAQVHHVTPLPVRKPEEST
jgi:hypothetical protein